MSIGHLGRRGFLTQQSLYFLRTHSRARSCAFSSWYGVICFATAFRNLPPFSLTFVAAIFPRITAEALPCSDTILTIHDDDIFFGRVHKTQTPSIKFPTAHTKKRKYASVPVSINWDNFSSFLYEFGENTSNSSIDINRKINATNIVILKNINMYFAIFPNTLLFIFISTTSNYPMTLTLPRSTTIVR